MGCWNTGCCQDIPNGFVDCGTVGDSCCGEVWPHGLLGVKVWDCVCRRKGLLDCRWGSIAGE